MSQWAVERTIGKLLTDDVFRERFFTDPAVVSFNAGLELSGVELDALLRLPKQALAHFSRLLDDRICWLPFDEQQRPERGEEVDMEGDRLLVGVRTGGGTAQGARTPRAGERMASPNALEKAGGGADPAGDP